MRVCVCVSVCVCVLVRAHVIYLCVPWPVILSKISAIAAIVVTVAVVGNDEQPAWLTTNDVRSAAAILSDTSACVGGLARVWDVHPSKLLESC